MTPPYRDSFPSDHDHLLLRYSSPDRLFFSSTTPQTSSSSSSLFFSGLDHSNAHDPRSLELKHEDGAGQIIMACNKDQAEVETGLRFTIWKQIEKSDQNSSCCENNLINNDLVRSSSSSSKIRLVINSNQTNNDSPGFQDLNPMSSLPDQSNKRSALNDGGGAIIRTCSDCNTTKTPLWRSGPRGPKSLCNACGIRQRKARRAMAAAAAAANGAIPTAVVLKTNKAVQQRKIMKPKMKKKCKAVVSGGDGGGGRKKLSFEEMKMVRRLSEISSAYQRVFPQDEREAAILLMTLSYGLISG